MGDSRGIGPGCWVKDRFPGDGPNPLHRVVENLPGCSVSPEGFNIVLVEDPSVGSRFRASTYDLVRVSELEARAIDLAERVAFTKAHGSPALAAQVSRKAGEP